jgi:hypothetical protein
MERPANPSRLAPAETRLFRREPAPDFPELSRRVFEHCRAIREAPRAGARGLMAKNDFPLHSTGRQFQRYLEFWRRAEWRDLAAAAVGALNQGEP